MKNNIILISVVLFVLLSCTGTKTVTNKPQTEGAINDTVKIVNDSLQYEVIIIDNGYSTWLNSRALPRNYHSQQFLEMKNRLYVNEWNNRVLEPHRFDPNLYEMSINYSPTTNYGYEVNYLIYNYMIYFQNTFKQKLFGIVPLR